jgi:hypothetical protein
MHHYRIASYHIVSQCVISRKTISVVGIGVCERGGKPCLRIVHFVSLRHIFSEKLQTIVLEIYTQIFMSFYLLS